LNVQIIIELNEFVDLSKGHPTKVFRDIYRKVLRGFNNHIQVLLSVESSAFL
jgi:PHP family Zn ribbon phosphoesterase